MIGAALLKALRTLVVIVLLFDKIKERRHITGRDDGHEVPDETINAARVLLVDFHIIATGLAERLRRTVAVIRKQIKRKIGRKWSISAFTRAAVTLPCAFAVIPGFARNRLRSVVKLGCNLILLPSYDRITASTNRLAATKIPHALS